MKESYNGTEPGRPVVTKGRETGAADMAPSATAFASDRGTIRFAPPRKIWPSENHAGSTANSAPRAELSS